MHKINHSSIALGLIFVSILSIFFYYDLWKQNRITLDAPSYYTYLPAVIIHNDLELIFIDAIPEYYEEKIWYYHLENGKKLIKHPMGISVALSPFFITGHFIAKITNSVQDGYSLPYQNAVSLGVLIYLFSGLFFLLKILLQFFSDKIVAFTLIAITIGTNLLWYSTFELLMPHAISFSLICICIFTFFNWLETSNNKYLFLFAVVFGLSVLVRQLSATIIIYFLIYAIISKGKLNNFLYFIKPKIKAISFAAFISIAIASLQLFYWKYITGNWIYDPYIGEHFIFSENKMLPFLFGFRKGLFIYSPILIFFIIGLIYFFKHNKALLYSTLTIFLLSVFIFSSWWAWSYGISWGVRPMIDYYPIMSLPLAAGFNYFYNNKISKIILFLAFPLLIALNLFQTWQYKNGLIHYDDMTEDAYFKGLFQTAPSQEWYDRLRPYAWERRKKGLAEIKYSRKLIFNLNESKPFYLTGNNLLNVSVNPRAQNAVAAYASNFGVNELFYIEKINGDTVSLRAGNGLLLSVKNNYDNIITATEQKVGNKEKFILEYIHEGNNLIAFRSMNGKYISASGKFPYTLHANKFNRGQNETFRINLLN